MGDTQQLEQVLLALNDPNDVARQNAEAFLAEWKKQPDLAVTSFVTLLRTSQVEQARETAAVVLRRIGFYAIDSPLLWPHTSSDVRVQVREQLLNCMRDETLPRVRRKLCDCICEIAKDDDCEPWPTLLPALHQLTQSPSPHHREAAYHIFANHPGVFGAQLDRYLGVIHDLLVGALAETEQSMDVRVAALQATIAFIRCEQIGKSKGIFHDIVPPMLALILTCTQSPTTEKEGTQALQAFVELAETEPLFLRPYLPMIVQTMTAITANDKIEDDGRRLAIEVLTELCEKRPQMIRKMGEFTGIVLPAVFSLMVEIEDDDEWSQADDIEDDVDESNSIYAEQIMDRLACALGGKTVLPVAFQHIAQMLQNTDWRHRYAALMTISSIGEGCQPVMGRELGRVIEMVVPYLQDAHPRVRYAACNALGQMSTDFASDLQTKYHAVVVPALIATTQDPHPRVKAHAAAALVNFSEGCDKELLNPYLDSLLSNLYELLRTPRRVVQEQALQTIAVIAESAKDLFAKYYDTFIPVLLLILEQAVGHDQRLMRGKAMECLSLICYVVGPERSRQDALRTMELLAQTPPEQMAADDPQATYVDWACLRLCNTLGADFMPYLAFVMPPLLAKARLKPDLAILDSDDPNAEAAYDAADGWEFVHIHSQKIGINTTALEERSAAVDLLGMYAAKLKGGFAPYVQEVAEIMVQSLGFLFHDGVRTGAAAALAPLLTCAMEANMGADAIGAMWGGMVAEMARILTDETTQDTLVDLLDGLDNALKVAGPNSLTVEHQQQLGRALFIQLQHINARALERQEKRGDVDYDEELEEEIENDDVTDELILKDMSDVMHTLFRLHGPGLAPLWDVVAGAFAQLLDPARAEGDRSWALCVFDDLIEFTGPLSFNYHALFLPQLVNSLHDPASGVRHAAAYGMGIAAQFGGEQYTAACAEALPILVAMVTAADARTDENIDCTENAVSAVGKILRHRPAAVGAAKDQLIGQWLLWLPLTSNPDEGGAVYGYLCELAEQGHAAVASSLAHVAAVLAYAADTEGVEEDNLNPRVKGLLRQLAQHQPAAFVSMAPDLAQKVQRIMAQQP